MRVQATRPVPQDRSEESILNDEEGGIPPDVEKREQAIAKRTEARSVRRRGAIGDGCMC